MSSSHMGTTPQAKIPLKCDVCPKKPKFSDASHLLTHISSKTHLSNIFKTRVRSDIDTESRRLIEDYDQWYAEWSIQDLLAERLAQKDGKMTKPDRARRGKKETGGHGRGPVGPAGATNSVTNGGLNVNAQLPTGPNPGATMQFGMGGGVYAGGMQPIQFMSGGPIPRIDPSLGDQVPYNGAGMSHPQYSTHGTTNWFGNRPHTHNTRVFGPGGATGPQDVDHSHNTTFFNGIPPGQATGFAMPLANTSQYQVPPTNLAKVTPMAPPPPPTPTNGRATDQRQAKIMAIARLQNTRDDTESLTQASQTPAGTPTDDQSVASTPDIVYVPGVSGNCPAITLKGHIWPGMEGFDAATVTQRAARNQKKDVAVYDRLEEASIDIAARCGFERKGKVNLDANISLGADLFELIKRKPITGHPTESSLGSPTPSPRHSVNRRNGQAGLRQRRVNARAGPSTDLNRRTENDLSAVMYGRGQLSVYRDGNDEDDRQSVDTFAGYGAAHAGHPNKRFKGNPNQENGYLNAVVADSLKTPVGAINSGPPSIMQSIETPWYPPRMQPMAGTFTPFLQPNPALAPPPDPFFNMSGPSQPRLSPGRPSFTYGTGSQLFSPTGMQLSPMRQAFLQSSPHGTTSFAPLAHQASGMMASPNVISFSSPSHQQMHHIRAHSLGMHNSNFGPPLDGGNTAVDVGFDLTGLDSLAEVAAQNLGGGDGDEGKTVTAASDDNA